MAHIGDATQTIITLVSYDIELVLVAPSDSLHNIIFIIINCKLQGPWTLDTLDNEIKRNDWPLV